MNGGRDRPRGPPQYGGPNQPPPRRGTNDSRNGSAAMRPTTSSQGMSRAEKFEQEKRKIMESCFGKQDADGAAVESYITHVRVVEDAAYPSSPPPPNSPADNRKQRVIIVAVRQSGRVRMHKARENHDGTFSIGKTWVLDDLSAIKGYTLAPEPNYTQWAGDTGFCVTIGKPYFWAAPTSKEKDFFITSLIKIYRKYTGGKIPDLSGFDAAERDSLLGALPQGTQAPPPQAPAQSPARRPDINQPLNQPRPPSSNANRSRPPSPFSNRAPSRDGQRRSSQDQGYRSFSQDQAPPMPGALAPGRPTPPYRPTTPQSQPRDLSTSPGKSRIPMGGDTPPVPYNQYAMRKGPQQSTDSLDSAYSKQTGRSRLGSNGERFQENRPGFGERSELRRPSGTPGPPGHQRQPSGPDSIPESLPERRRPPMPQPMASSGQKSIVSEAASEVFSTPMGTPGEARQDRSRPSTRDGPRPHQAYFPSQSDAPPPEVPQHSSEPTIPQIAPLSPRKQPPPQPFAPPTASLPPPPDSAPQAETTQDDLAISPPPIPTGPTSPTSPTDSVADSESGDVRPGLGPMMKKKSQKDLAAILRKAATAQGAFKPRAGGAAQRFLAAAAAAKDAKNKTEPDGITGVVPAPMLRGLNIDTSRSGTPDPNAQGASVPPSPRFAPGHDRKSSGPGALKFEPPNIQITRAQTDDETARQRAAAEQKEKEREEAAALLAAKRERQASSNATYCTALGIDPALIGSRGGDFMDLLESFGWDGEFEDGKAVDDLEADLRRELGRVQASSWLGHLEKQEGKGGREVEGLAEAMDRALEECERFDGLLTLYSHELGTLAEDVTFIENQFKNLSGL